MTLLSPLRSPLDASGLSIKTVFEGPSSSPRTAEPHLTAPTQNGVPMSVGYWTFSGDEMSDVLNRLAPYLPAYLEKVEPNPRGYGLDYNFKPFTGISTMPQVPHEYRADPRLKYTPKSEDAAEYRLREIAGKILHEVYETAYARWLDAAYVAALCTTVKDAAQRWAAYERESKALEEAYDYLRTPQAATEWLAALSRLVDAQERLRAAAEAFDDRAVEIAEVHDEYSHSDLRYAEALARAGHPEARTWCIADASAYRGQYWGSPQYAPLAEQARVLIEAQDAHVTKVGRLSGASTN
ncbi:hypothetical protein ACFC96_41155 [Streptomyces sp. NPDC055955]|uniref:hypothetical protein n=1 Tax=Streptomyces sp. NPDC055955 TaxID=3345665 RepID=UPI0035D6156C